MSSALWPYLDALREREYARWGDALRPGSSAARRFLDNCNACDTGRPDLMVLAGLLELMASRMPYASPVSPKSLSEVDRAALDARRAKARLSGFRKAHKLIVGTAIRSYRAAPYEMRRCGALLDIVENVFISPAERDYAAAAQRLAILESAQ